MAKTKAWYSQMTRGDKERILDHYLSNMDCSSGLWLDCGQLKDALQNLVKLAQSILVLELDDPVHSKLLKKICAAQPLPPGEIAARYIDTIGHGITCADEGSLDLVPYYDLINALFQDAYVEVTLRKINEYFQDMYPKHSELVRKYHECVVSHGSKEEAYDLLYRLYICDCLEDYDVLQASTYMMGYDGWKSSICLPFYAVYISMGSYEDTAEQDDMTAGVLYPNVCKLFNSFDRREKQGTSQGTETKDLSDHLKNAGQLPSVSRLIGTAVNETDYFQMPRQKLYASKYFAKYYKNRRAKLCAMMECDDDDLEAVFRNQFAQECTLEQYSTLIRLGEAYNIQPAALHTIFDQQIKGTDDSALPEITGWYLCGYYMNKLERILSDMIADKGEEVLETITRRDLYNELGADDLDEDIGYFTKTWVYDILFQLVNEKEQDYYRNLDFFCEGPTQSSQIMELRRDVASYKDLAERKEREIAVLTKKLEEKRPKHVESENEKKLRMSLIQADKDKEVLTNENDELKQKIADLEAYVDIVEKAMTEPQQEEVPKIGGIDEAILHSVRIAFVCGDADQICPDLRKAFPGCVIHETATQKAALRQTTDLVVYFTQHISHTMFFRFRSAYEGVPEYFYNGTNIDKLKAELSAYIKDILQSATTREK